MSLTMFAEYISQLEGEVALKTQESNILRSENTAYLQESKRYRGLVDTLLRYPTFTPFINDISKDPSVLGMPCQQQQQQQPEDSEPEFRTSIPLSSRSRSPNIRTSKSTSPLFLTSESSILIASRR